MTSESVQWSSISGSGLGRVLFACLLVGATVASATLAVPVSTATEDRELVVDPDGEGYDTIQAAVADADDGDRIVVRPAIYENSVLLDVSVTVVAPDGAILRGAGAAPESTGILIDADGVTVDGLAVEEFRRGIAVAGEARDWTLRDLRVRNCRFGVYATGHNGDWRLSNATFQGTDAAGAYVFGPADDGLLRDVTVRGGEVGLWISPLAEDLRVANATLVGNEDGLVVSPANPEWSRPGSATGEGESPTAWTVANSRFRDNEVGLDADTVAPVDWVVRNSTFVNASIAVEADHAGGDWRIESSTVRDSRTVGVNALGTTGAWTIVDTRIVGTSGVGVLALRTRGSWAIRHSTVANTSRNPNTRLPLTGVGIEARGSSPTWTVEHSVLADNAAGAINATDPDWDEGEVRYTEVDGTVATVTPEDAPIGDATDNWWGQASGPVEGQCVGAVDCSDPLQQRPDETARSGDATDDRDGTTDASGPATTSDVATSSDDKETTVGASSGPISIVVPVVVVAVFLVVGLYLRWR